MRHFSSLLVDSHHSSSNTEQTIQRYSASNVFNTSQSLVTKQDVIKYPNTPCNGYVSRRPDSFSGCLAYGSTTHRFSSCPNKTM